MGNNTNTNTNKNRNTNLKTNTNINTNTNTNTKVACHTFGLTFPLLVSISFVHIQFRRHLHCTANTQGDANTIDLKIQIHQYVPCKSLSVPFVHISSLAFLLLLLLQNKIKQSQLATQCKLVFVICLYLYFHNTMYVYLYMYSDISANYICSFFSQLNMS